MGNFWNFKIGLFLCAQLEAKGSKTKQTEWEAYFNWYIEASQWGHENQKVCNFKIASLHDTVSKSLLQIKIYALV